MLNSIKLYIAGVTGALFIGIAFSSCEKTFDEKTAQQKDFNNSTIAQVFVAMVNATRNYVYIDAKQVTGAGLATGGIFPASGHGFNVTPGLRAFLVRDTLGTSTQQQLSFGENMQAGRHHTIFVYDTITTPKQKTVIDNIVVPDDTTSRLRLANFIYNPNAVPAIDVFSFVRNANIFSNVNTTDVTPFITYPSGITDTLYFRDAGSTTTFLKVTISGGVTQKRSYTLVYRGSYRGTRTTTLYATR